MPSGHVLLKEVKWDDRMSSSLVTYSHTLFTEPTELFPMPAGKSVDFFVYGDPLLGIARRGTLVRP